MTSSQENSENSKELQPITIHFGDEIVDSHQGARHVVVDLLEDGVCAVFSVFDINGQEAFGAAGAGSTTREDIDHVNTTWEIERIIRAIYVGFNVGKPSSSFLNLIRSNAKKPPITLR